MIKNCNHSYYGENKQSNRPYLYCNIDNEICPLVRFCPTENKILNINGYANCNKKVEEVNKVPNGKYSVRFMDKGFLYVEIKDIGQIRKIQNPYDYVPKFVDVVEIDGQHYIKGYEPKVEEKVIEEPKVKTRNTKK